MSLEITLTQRNTISARLQSDLIKRGLHPLIYCFPHRQLYDRKVLKDALCA